MLSREFFEEKLEIIFKQISAMYGFKKLNTSVECIDPPNWYQCIAPIVLLLLITSLILKNWYEDN